MTLKDIAKQLTNAVQTVPNLVQILRDGFAGMEDEAGGIDYSETEQDTGLKWIDGKNIYQKTFTFTTASTSGSAADVGTIANVDQIIELKGIYKYNNEAYYSFPDNIGNDLNFLYYDIANSKIGCYTVGSSSRLSKPGICTALYTKAS